MLVSASNIQPVLPDKHLKQVWLPAGKSAARKSRQQKSPD
jgi:hypothetical protein